MKAEKSCDLPSASWRPRKVSGVIELKGLGAGVADDGSPSSEAGEDEMRGPSSNSMAGRKGRIPPSSTFCSL